MSDFLELELRMIMSHHVVASNRTLVHCRKKYFQPQSHLSSPLKNVHTMFLAERFCFLIYFVVNLAVNDRAVSQGLDPAS